jgi:hypothetical protein
MRSHRIELVRTPILITPYPTGRLFGGGAVLGTSCQATVVPSLRDISQQHLSQRVVLVENGDDRSRPEPQPLLVPHKSEFHPSTAEEVSRLEGMRKPETAPRDRDESRRPVGPRTLQTRFRIVDHGKQVIRMFRDHTEQVSRTEAVQ